jgi:hypothetical protein
MKNGIKNRFQHYIAAGLMVTASLSLSTVSAQKSKSKIKAEISSATAGKQDREYWSELLYKMAYPVVHNLAEETLKKICH